MDHDTPSSSLSPAQPPPSPSPSRGSYGSSSSAADLRDSFQDHDGEPTAEYTPLGDGHWILPLREENYFIDDPDGDLRVAGAESEGANHWRSPSPIGTSAAYRRPNRTYTPPTPGIGFQDAIPREPARFERVGAGFELRIAATADIWGVCSLTVIAATVFATAVAAILAWELY